MNIPETYEKVIFTNEMDGNLGRVYKFSDPDGKLGKSGWSFGKSQFDISNNPSAILCLRDCNFTSDEIAGLKAQTIADMKPLEKRLLCKCTTVDRYDDQQFKECLSVPAALCKNSGIVLTDGGLIALADYHNQFYMSRGGKMHNWLKGLGRPVTADDIYKFKLTLPWGLKRKDDVDRRHKNIIRILKEAA